MTRGMKATRLTAALGAWLWVWAAACTGNQQTPPTSSSGQLASSVVAAPAELILVGGVLHTMDPDKPRASAAAIRGKRIIAVGDDREIRALAGPNTRVIELAGRMATPGLVDAHCHLYGLGAALEAVLLGDATSAENAAEKAARAASELAAGEWLVGRGWDQTRWPGKAFPDHTVLDAKIADRPVALRRVDGHALWANKAALKIAGIDRTTPDPPGGRIMRNSAGEATGILVDAAIGLVERHIPEPSAEIRRRRIIRAARVAVEKGLTGVHEMGIDDATAAVYRQLVESGELPLRVQAYMSFSQDRVAAMPKSKTDPPNGDALFSVRGMKLYADGALGSRGAALLEPYSDEPGNRGLTILDGSKLTAIATTALESGWQLAIHAIGDAGNRAVLDAYEQALRTRPGADVRFRVEHAQVVAVSDLGRFGKLGILASMQPTHATSDMRWAEARVGQKRVRGAYAWRTILELGGRVVAGSDFPVEGVSPLLGIYAAVTRQDSDGNPPGGWYPDQRMTLDEVLYSFTVEPAYATFVENHQGRLRAGYAADITVFDRVLSSDRTLLQTNIDLTVVGGRIVFERQ